MTAESSQDLDLLEFRKEFMNREISVAYTLSEISAKISSASNCLSTLAADFNKVLDCQTTEIRELKALFEEKVAFYERTIDVQTQQINSLIEERSVVFREVTALNEYINKISDRHYAKQNELPFKFEAGFKALEVLAESAKVARDQALGSDDSMLGMLRSIMAKQDEIVQSLGSLSPSLLSSAKSETALPDLPIAEPDDIDPADVDLLLTSCLFDSEWYRERYDLKQSSAVDLAIHYIREGVRRGLAPSLKFDARAYLAMNRDVMDAGLNPLVHYIRYGKAEGRPVKTLEADVVIFDP